MSSLCRSYAANLHAIDSMSQLTIASDAPFEDTTEYGQESTLAIDVPEFSYHSDVGSDADEGEHSLASSASQESPRLTFPSPTGLDAEVSASRGVRENVPSSVLFVLALTFSRRFILQDFEFLQTKGLENCTSLKQLGSGGYGNVDLVQVRLCGLICAGLASNSEDVMIGRSVTCRAVAGRLLDFRDSSVRPAATRNTVGLWLHLGACASNHVDRSALCRGDLVRGSFASRGSSAHVSRNSTALQVSLPSGRNIVAARKVIHSPLYGLARYERELRGLLLGGECPFMVDVYASRCNEDAGQYEFLLEYAPNGTMGDMLKAMEQRRRGKEKLLMPVNRVQYYAACLLQGLQFVHSRGQAHRVS